MRTFLRGKVTLLFMAFALVLALPAIALADQITGDADNDAIASPHANEKVATQAPGSAAVAYDFSAYIKETGNAGDDVFKNAGDYVSVNVARSGDWLDSSDSGSPASLTFTRAEGYEVAKGGTIKIKVPCGATGTKCA